MGVEGPAGPKVNSFYERSNFVTEVPRTAKEKDFENYELLH